MKKTALQIYFNGLELCYQFPIEKETFMKHWNNQIDGAGYFKGEDESGQCVIINPSQCGVIEIYERSF